MNSFITNQAKNLTKPNDKFPAIDWITIEDMRRGTSSYAAPSSTK
jgi:hypothetical protein